MRNFSWSASQNFGSQGESVAPVASSSEGWNVNSLAKLKYFMWSECAYAMRFRAASRFFALADASGSESHGTRSRIGVPGTQL